MVSDVATSHGRAVRFRPTRFLIIMSMSEWVGDAADELARLRPPSVSKKRATIIGMVDARLSNIPESEVFRRPETCSKTTYYGRWLPDETFSSVLENVLAIAYANRDNRAMRALQRSGERLALAAPVAVMKLVELLQSDNERIALGAALGILDRAGVDVVAGNSEPMRKLVTYAEVREELDRIAGGLARRAELMRRIEGGDLGDGVEALGEDDGMIDGELV